jgi:hypothetical protein
MIREGAMWDRLVATNGRPKRRSRLLSRQAAAAFLGTGPETLSLWEERFGYPVPAGSVGGEPLYDEDTLMSLRYALNTELSIASAIGEARRRSLRTQTT